MTDNWSHTLNSELIKLYQTLKKINKENLDRKVWHFLRLIEFYEFLHIFGEALSSTSSGRLSHTLCSRYRNIFTLCSQYRNIFSEIRVN